MLLANAGAAVATRVSAEIRTVVSLFKWGSPFGTTVVWHTPKGFASGSVPVR